MNNPSIDLSRQDQPIEELRRKAKKARRKSNLWTQEEIDLSIAEGNRLYRLLCLKKK